MPVQQLNEDFNGIYVLLFSVNKNISIKIGSLGKIFFLKGIYAYIGSAQSGVKKRVARHLSKKKKKFWHIDYLLDSKFVKIIEVFYLNAPKPKECKVASLLCRKYSFIGYFGCSDCSCKSHLIFLRDAKTYSLRDSLNKLGFLRLNLKKTKKR
ncbi:MAG: GIY-YIG nuclease family protein [Candidatus Diapherotrites archaeon]